VSEGEEVVPTHHDRIRVLRLPERLSDRDGWLPTLDACVEAGHLANAVALLREARAGLPTERRLVWSRRLLARIPPRAARHPRRLTFPRIPLRAGPRRAGRGAGARRTKVRDTPRAGGQS
jgi:hypothetical protein